jgi:hypothetical protein
MKRLLLIVISFLAVTFVEFIENNLGIKGSFIWGTLAILWSQLCLEISQKKDIKLERFLYKVVFYVLLIGGSYILILGIIDLIKKK